MKFFQGILCVFSILTAEPLFAAQCAESQSLKNLKMTVCLLKGTETDLGYSDIEVTYSNISNRTLFLRIENDSLRRFEISLTQDKIDLTKRTISDDDCFPMPTYSSFSDLALGSGEDITYQLKLSKFKTIAKRMKANLDKAFFLSFRPPTNYFFEGESSSTASSLRVNEEHDAGQVSSFIFFEDLYINWAGQKNDNKRDN